MFKDEQWTMGATSIEFLDKPNLEDVEREISGKFEGTRQSFGFIGDCFVPKSWVSTEKLRGYDRVTVLARKSWGKKKGKWGWTAIKVTSREPNKLESNSLHQSGGIFGRQTLHESIQPPLDVEKHAFFRGYKPEATRIQLL